MTRMDVKGVSVTVTSQNDMDFISLTDMLKAKDGDFFISDWLRNRNTVEFLGIWEQVHNPSFNYGEFAVIKSQAGLNSYKISVKEWVEKTNAIGQTAQQWRDAHPKQNGNIRDEANAAQLVCLANLETLNAHFIQQGLEQSERLRLLNQTAIGQMTLLLADRGVQRLQGAKKP
jgi:hypothetical protein